MSHSFYKDQESKPDILKTASFLFLFFNVDNKISRHVDQKADCGSQRHPRPSRIISALERSILLTWGLNAEGEKSNLGKRWKRTARESKMQTCNMHYGVRDSNLSRRDSTHCM